MTAAPPQRNQRILVIDDNRAIHGDFQKILGEADGEDAALLAAEAELFGTPPPLSFEVDTASQGEEGLRMVEQSQAQGRPYALAFVDVRMPPGWDGIETTRRIWEVCPDLQIVICTAYADCSWEEMQEQLQPMDRLLILKKPFDTIEVIQMANALTEKWRLLQGSKSRLEDLEQMVAQRTRDLEVSQAVALDMMKDAVLNSEKVEQAYRALKREEAEREKVEKQYHEQTSQFLRSQRMESVGRLASGIAHDMNNVLAPILLSTFMLRQQLGPTEYEKTLLNIETSTHRGADLVKQLLSFGRGASGRRAAVGPNRLVLEMEKLMRGTFPKNISILSQTPEEVWSVIGDATQFHQVLLNLCVNARDAMPDGGTLSLTTRNVRFNEGEAPVHPEASAGPYVCLEVSDTGQGIASEVMDKIFDPFFTTKEVGKGTGLGLSTVMSIVRGHKGFVTLRSEIHLGSTFEIYLPAVPGMTEDPEAASRSGSSSSSHAPPRGNGELILIVDDEAGIREVVRKTLLHHGYQVLAASDGIEAVTEYSKHRDDIKAVLTDIMMPRMDGVTMIRMLRRMDSTLKIVASSGIASVNGDVADDADRSAELADLGVPRLLRKPYTAGEILATIGDLLAQD